MGQRRKVSTRGMSKYKNKQGSQGHWEESENNSGNDWAVGAILGPD